MSKVTTLSLLTVLAFASVTAVNNVFTSQTIDAPTSYPDAPTHRNSIASPTLPTLGAAGSTYNDPTFGNRVLRVTDGNTDSENIGRAFATGGQHAWNSNSTRFYILGPGGGIVPFTFNSTTFVATKGSSNLTGFYLEPTFSYSEPDVMYGASAAQNQTIRKYDFDSDTYSDVLDLRTTVVGWTWTDTYIGGVAISKGSPEKMLAFYGGGGQDTHRFVCWFDRANPANRKVLDTVANTIDGVATNIPINILLHAAYMDKSGRYVILGATAGDIAAGDAAQWFWDTQTDIITAGSPAQMHGGHDATGYGTRLNNSEGNLTFDDAQWIWHPDLTNPNTSYEIVNPVLTPQSVAKFSEHGSWNNARPDALTPYFSGTFTRGTVRTTPRAWDDEIIGILPDDDPANVIVYRFAHTFTDARSDSAPVDEGRIGFWYTPRIQVSDNGRYVLFTSNMRKTLGDESGGGWEPPSNTKRHDVFLLELPTGDTPVENEPYGGTPWPIAGTIQAEDFDTGGQGVGYNDEEETNQGGSVYRSTGVDLEDSSDTGGGVNVGFIGVNEWLLYTVNVSTSGAYNLQFRVAREPVGDGVFHLEINGVDTTGPITLPSTGGWQTWTTVTKTGILLTAGEQEWKIVFDSADPGGVGNLNWIAGVSADIPRRKVRIRIRG